MLYCAALVLILSPVGSPLEQTGIAGPTGGPTVPATAPPQGSAGRSQESAPTAGGTAVVADGPEVAPPAEPGPPSAATADRAAGAGPLPPGTHRPVPLSAAPTTAGSAVSVGGFVYGALGLASYDVSDTYDYELGFVLPEVEFDATLHYGELAGVRVDLNLQAEGLSAARVAGNRTRTLVESIVEQAVATARLGPALVAAGRMHVPIATEAIDPVDRLALSRSHLALLAAPSLLTGASFEMSLGHALGVFAFVGNGWDLAFDINRSKTFGGGLTHRLGGVEGRLGALVGRERADERNVRWLIDYGATIDVEALVVGVQALYGREQGLGRVSATRVDPRRSALWYGGRLDVAYDFAAGSAGSAPLRAGARFEYLRDYDLVLGLPAYPSLPPLTTLFGVTLTGRYGIAAGLDLALEYAVDFERGDRPGVSIRRNEPVFPRFWKLADWFVTQRATIAFVAEL